LQLSSNWQFVTDGVMGGVSTGILRQDMVQGRKATRLSGSVSLENNGGFIQMAADLIDGAGTFDASKWSGIEIDILGNGETYELRLRTDQLSRPWQSYRSAFVAPPQWITKRFPFAAFEPHRTDAPFDPRRLRRIGILAIGSEFEADIAVAGIGFYGAADLAKTGRA
jgi:hypothetical protein